jgi:hypothetical protein
LKELQARLARGDKAEIIGERGQPPWQRDLLGKAALSKTADGICTLESRSRSLVALVMDPQRDAYLFEIWLRMHDASEDGMAGLFFGHTSVAGDPPLQAFCTVAFADRQGFAGKVLTDMWLCSRVEVAKPVNNQAGLPLNKRFDVKDQVGKWQRLAVEVGPDGWTVWWNEDKLGTLSRAVLQKTCLLQLFLGVPRPASGLPEFAPRSPLGLYVYQATVSVRNVTVQTLPK